MPAKKTETAPRKKEKMASKPPAKTKRTKKTPNVPEKDKDFYIVGMGASAGGLEAFETFFQNMPADSGMAFVLVPHLDPSHNSIMPELIQKKTKLQVREIKDGTEVKPNAVYIVPSNRNLAILNGSLQLLEPSKHSDPRLPIDYFFRSLAQDKKTLAIGLILSGMGSDGTIGLRAIKGESGMTMVQDPQSAKYDSMPDSAIKTGRVDYILPAEKMPQQLIKYAKHADTKSALNMSSPEGKIPDAIKKIYILLRNQIGHDFSFYKSTTLSRRIERRMNVHQIAEVSAYVRYLQQTPHEVTSLFKELLIGVTSFFRDPDAFDILKQKVLTKIVADKAADTPLRIWVPGCSTGEEAYSVAILLQECLDEANRNLKVQIFATDIDEDAVTVARTGIYPESISADMKAERLKRFFSKDNGTYIISKNIREMLIFAPQNVIQDPPFTKLDLICCRNLLIYLESVLQKKLLPLFHYSLRPQGFLFLGTSETIGDFQDIFAVVHKKWKIFKRKISPP